MAIRDQVIAHPRIRPQSEDARAPVRAADQVRRRRTDLALSVFFDLAPLEAQWRRLETIGDCTVFQCYDWLAAWQRNIGRATRTTPVIVVGHARSGEPALILPLAVRAFGPIRQLTFLGRELGDYNAPLLGPMFLETCAPHAFPALWAQIGALLAGDPRSRHDLVVLDKMPERVGAQANPLMELDLTLNPSGAYLTALAAADWESFYAAKRSSATRRRDRTKRKRLAEHGEVRMVTPEDPAEIAATLATLIDQKRRAFARMGVSDIFARAHQRDFYLDLATNPRTRELVHVSRLQVGELFAAINFGLAFRGGYLHILASYDEGPLSRFGPGAAHLHELMRHALERGCSFFDFTIGDEPYKRDWSDTEIKLFDHVGATTARGRAAASVVETLRAAKRRIKQSPQLWSAAQRLRAALASLSRKASGEKAASGAHQDAGS